MVNTMNPNNLDDKNAERILDGYFENARQVQCPKTMKQKLYTETVSKRSFSGRLAFSGVAAAAFVAFFSHSMYQQNRINQAQQDLNVAMHYIQKMTFKSLSSVKTNGIQPAVIKPLAKSVASI